MIQPTRFLPGPKLYVDPMIYTEINDAVEQFACELDRNKLTMKRLVGGGEFAEVFTGTLVKSNGIVADVAVKTLKVS